MSLPSKDDWIAAPANRAQIIRGEATDYFNGYYSDRTFENYYRNATLNLRPGALGAGRRRVT